MKLIKIATIPLKILVITIGVIISPMVIPLTWIVDDEIKTIEDATVIYFKGLRRAL
jgi:hypothetical protein